MVKKKYLWTNSKDYNYFRRDGVLTRIIAPKGTPEFDAEYWAIMRGKNIEPARSFKKLIEDYRNSSKWSNLAPRTRSDYEGVHLYLLEKVGSQDCTRMQRSDVINARESQRDRVRFANYIVQVTRILMEHAIDLGWRQDNPARNVPALKTPEAKKQSHIPWTDEAVSKFRHKAGPVELLIFELGLGSIQRPNDWTRFKWSDYDGANLRIIQGKTGVILKLPCTERLKGLLNQQKQTGETILVNRKGDPLPYRTMAQIMQKERSRLGLELYDLHALRYRGVMELAWAGCTDDEIASFSGHASKAMIRMYAGKARQETAAERALIKRESNRR